jgi:hypothetical protein
MLQGVVIAIESLGLETQEINRLNDTNQRILELELAKVKTVRMLMFFQGTAINLFRALFLLQLLILAQKPAPRNPGGAVPDGIESLEFSAVTYRHPGARFRPARRQPRRSLG